MPCARPAARRAAAAAARPPAAVAAAARRAARPAPPGPPRRRGAAAAVDAPAAADAADASAAAVVAPLLALARFSPTTGLADGPASLARVWPYSVPALDAALEAGAPVLAALDLPGLTGLAAALAAAGHAREPALAQLGDAAAAHLAAAPPPGDRVAALARLRCCAQLGASFARLGVLHAGLMTQLAVSGAALLRQGGLLAPSRRAHGRALALLAGGFAALRLHPPQLFRALAELLKRQRRVLALLGPEESMLLLWAFGRVGHADPPAQLLLTQRAATQVGMLDCQGLAHAYAQCAGAGLDAPPLLAALRKATRQRLPAMRPVQLTALLAALAALGSRDMLLLDDLARAVHNKLANFSAGEVAAALAACGLLRYRNPWLLERAAKVLVSRQLRKAAALTGAQLGDVLQACCALRYHNTLLLGHLGAVAAEALAPGWRAGELAAALRGFAAARFAQPALQLAAAARLRELAARPPGEQARAELPALAEAALELCSLPPAGGTAAERALGSEAVAAVAAAALQAGAGCACRNLVRLAVALALLAAERPDGLATGSAAGDPQREVLRAVRARLAGAADAQQLAALGGRELAWLMQLLWLAEQRDRAGSGGGGQPAQPDWRLGLPEGLVAAHLAAQRQRDLAAQQDGGDGSRALLQAAAAAVRRQVPGAEVAFGVALPDSAILLPAAVLPAPQAGGAAVRGTAAAPGVAAQQGGQPLSAELRGSQRGATLPSGVAAQLAVCRERGAPVALAAAGQGPLGLGAWHTSSAPARLLPAAQLWVDGLAAAGWTTLLLHEPGSDSSESE
ncbi:RAA3 [Scenedesmus sp. PABB004]|nr:RAA3 [Scenedesmus sp. PABB004]